MIRVNGKVGKKLFEMMDDGKVVVDGETVTDSKKLKEKLEEKKNESEDE